MQQSEPVALALVGRGDGDGTEGGNSVRQARVRTGGSAVVQALVVSALPVVEGCGYFGERGADEHDMPDEFVAFLHDEG